MKEKTMFVFYIARFDTNLSHEQNTRKGIWKIKKKGKKLKVNGKSERVKNKIGCITTISQTRPDVDLETT